MCIFFQKMHDKVPPGRWVARRYFYFMKTLDFFKSLYAILYLVIELHNPVRTATKGALARTPFLFSNNQRNKCVFYVEMLETI